MALEVYKIEFKKVVMRCHKTLQASGMGTQKFYGLDHVVDALHAVGRIEYLHARLLEGALKQFKARYGKTSKHINSATDEAITRMNLDILAEGQHCQSFVQELNTPTLQVI